MKVLIEKVTPQIAQIMLSKNKSNRPISDGHVYRLRKAMMSGEWVEMNGESLKFDYDGNLIDGQHRLTALIQAGATINFLVISELDPSVFDSIDQVRIRSLSDVMACNGVLNSTNMAAGVKLYYAILNGWQQARNSVANRPSPKSLSALYFLDPDSFQDTQHKAARWASKFRALSPAYYFALYHILKSKNKDRAALFFELLSSGENISNGNPVYALRNALIKSMGKKSGISQSIKLAYVIRAWNAFYQGKQLMTIYYSPDNNEFPKFKGI